MLPTMSPYSFGYVLVLFPRYHNGPNPSHRHTHLMISVDPSESFGSALCQRYTPHSRQSLLLFTDPYVSKHTHTRWVHARSTELILQFARALLRAHRIFAASLCENVGAEGRMIWSLVTEVGASTAPRFQDKQTLSLVQTLSSDSRKLRS